MKGVKVTIHGSDEGRTMYGVEPLTHNRGRNLSRRWTNGCLKGIEIPVLLELDKALNYGGFVLNDHIMRMSEYDAEHLQPEKEKALVGYVKDGKEVRTALLDIYRQDMPRREGIGSIRAYWIKETDAKRLMS